MYCPYCKNQTRDNSIFCSQCGKHIGSYGSTQPARTGKLIKRNKKTVVGYVCILALSIALIAIPILATSGSKSVIGTWRSSSGKEISFSSNGSFEDFRGYGHYTIYDGKKLSLVYEDWDWLGTNYTYEYGGDWYISGNTLYLSGDYYTKK